jgi:hypothetical protein
MSGVSALAHTPYEGTGGSKDNRPTASTDYSYPSPCNIPCVVAETADLGCKSAHFANGATAITMGWLSFTSTHNDQACRLNFDKRAAEGNVSRPPGPKPGGAYTRYRVMCSSAEIASCCSSWSIRTDTQQMGHDK